MALTKAHIQVRQGLKTNLDATLLAGEIGFATDTREPFIGSSVGNIAMIGPHVTPEMFQANTTPGTTDMTAGLQAAINTGKKVALAANTTYLFSNLKIDASYFGGIIGQGWSSILKSTAAANVALQIGTVASVESCLLEGFTLQGNATNLGGIQIGSTPQYVAWLKMRGVRVTGFTKAGSGYGVGFYCAQEVDIEDCNVSVNAINYYRPNVGSLTSCQIHGWAGYMGLSTACGAYFAGTVSDLRFKDMVIESNQKNAITSGRCSNIIIDNVDFEDNNNTNTGSGVIDIGSSDPGYATLNMQNCHVSETPRAGNPFLRLGFVQKSIVAHNEGYLLSGTITGATTQCVFIDNGFQDFTTYGALLGDIWNEEWDATDPTQRNIAGFPRFSKMFVYGAPADPSLVGANNPQLCKIKATDNIQIDFGLMGSAPYGGWIQSRDVFNSIAKVLAINPLGGYVGFGHMNPTADIHLKREANVTVTSECVGDFLPMIELKRSGGSVSVNADWYSYIDAGGHLRFYNAQTDKTPFLIRYGADNNALYVDDNENVGISDTVFGASATQTLGIRTGVAPTTHVDDVIQIFSIDSSDGAATLGLFLEQAVEAIGTFTPSDKIKIKINGTEYWIQLDAV